MISCPHCASSTVDEQGRRTALGYRTFRCSTCQRSFNERTGTAFNFLEFPTDVVLLVVRWRLRYKLSLRDLAEMFLERGFEFTHEADPLETRDQSLCPAGPGPRRVNEVASVGKRSAYFHNERPPPITCALARSVAIAHGRDWRFPRPERLCRSQ